MTATTAANRTLRRALDSPGLAVGTIALVVLPLLGMTALAIAGVTVPWPLAAGWLVVVGLFGAAWLVDVEDRETTVAICSAAIGVRLALGLVLLTFFRAEIFHSFDDAGRYLDIGSQIAAGWRDGQPIDLLSLYGLTVAGYYYMVAAIRYVVGPELFVVLCANAAIASVTAGGVYRLAALLGASRKERVLAMTVASFIPSVVFWSALPLKDTPITLVLVVGLVAALQIATARRLGALVALLVAVALMAWFRLYATLFISFAAIALLIVRGTWLRAPAWAAVVVVSVLAVQVWTLQSPVGQQVTLAATDLDELQRQRDIFDRGASAPGGGEPVTRWDMPAAASSASAAGGSAAPASAAPSASASPVAAPAAQTIGGRLARYLELAVNEPIYILHFVLLPIPFVTPGHLVDLALPEMIVWYLAIPVAVVGFLLLFRRRPEPTVVVALTIAAMAVVYGTLVSNAGSIIRYRAQALVLLAIPIVVGALFLWDHFIGRKRDDADRLAPTV